MKSISTRITATIKNQKTGENQQVQCSVKTYVLRHCARIRFPNENFDFAFRTIKKHASELLAYIESTRPETKHMGDVIACALLRAALPLDQQVNYNLEDVYELN